MSAFEILVSMVPHDKAELVSNAAVEAGSFGGTVFMGRKISASNLIANLGLGGATLDIVYIVVESSTKQTIYNAIVQACQNEKRDFGCLFTMEVESLLKTGNISKGDAIMTQNKSHDLITIILNRGYADDAMAAARKAGAGGGTVVNARGTAREDDAKFFGMHIVPEKEMLMIVVEKEKKDAVLEAIRTLPCLSEPGSGIAFCSAAEDFTLLGKK